MITITLGELAAAEDVLQRLMTIPLPPRTSYHLAKLAKYVRDEMVIYHAQRTALIKELGRERQATEAELARGSAPTIIEVESASRAEFDARLADTRAITVTIPWAPLSVSALGATPVTAVDVWLLGPLVVDE